MITSAKYTDETKTQIIFVEDGITSFCPADEENASYKKMLIQEIVIEDSE